MSADVASSSRDVPDSGRPTEPTEPTGSTGSTDRADRSVPDSAPAASTPIASATEIVTVADAMAHILERMHAQIDTAIEGNAPLNEAIRGDADVRSVFYTLLPEQFQRQVFIQISREMRSWPRLRPLFGAPPYAFLGPMDMGMLNASGLAHRRTNMTYDYAQIPNYTQFGTPQLIDEYEREYRVVDPGVRENDTLPCNLEHAGSNGHIRLVVRVHRHSRKERIKRIRDQALKKTVMFPVPGDRIELTETKRLLELQGRGVADASARVSVRVAHVLPRGLNASTAAILGTRVS